MTPVTFSPADVNQLLTEATWAFVAPKRARARSAVRYLPYDAELGSDTAFA